MSIWLSTPRAGEGFGATRDRCGARRATATGVMRGAVVMAREHDTSGYDATFAALAEVIGATFVTADERLAGQLTVYPFVHFLGDLEASA